MFYKTTIIPADDPKLAKRLLKQLIYEEPHVLYVVLGTGPAAEKTVERASRLAGAPLEPRWVVWVRDPKSVQTIIDELQGPDELLELLPKARAFTLDLVDIVRDVTRRDEGTPSLTRVLLAYAKAGKKPEEPA